MKKINKKLIISFLKENKVVLEKEFGINRIALFGSFARNEENIDSDIDLLIEVRVKNFKNRMQLKKYLENKFNRKVDISYFDSPRLLIKEDIEKDLIYA